MNPPDRGRGAPAGDAGPDGTAGDRRAEPPRRVTFAIASCQYPPGLVEEFIAYASLRRLHGLLAGREPGEPVPARLFLLGDRIYVDATAGLFDPVGQRDLHEGAWDKLEASAAHAALLARRIPVHSLIDDHEIWDNWEPHPDDPYPTPTSPDAFPADPARRENLARLNDGRDAFLRHARAGRARPTPVGDSPLPLWESLRADGLSFFLADTRTERHARNAATICAARIMSEAQFSALLAWLDEQHRADLADPDGGVRPKFVLTPSILLPRKLVLAEAGHPGAALRSDAWDGYPASLHALLAHIARTGIGNVVFLSGDEHLSCVARAELVVAGGAPVVVHSVHASGLHTPYPFANSVAADFAADERFGFATPGDAGSRVECRVATRFARIREGFATIEVVHDACGWSATTRFFEGWNHRPGEAGTVDRIPLF